MAVPGLSIAVDGVAQAALPGTPAPWNVPTDTWMSDMKDTIGTKTLATIPIPGTHQSTTYNLNSAVGGVAPDTPFDPRSDIAEAFDDCPTLLQSICDVFENIAVGTTGEVIAGASFRWGSNQNRDLGQQLNDGIRFFDIRLCQGPDGLPRACHGMFSNRSFQQDLNDVSTFMAAHPDEFVIMTIRATSDWTVPTSTISSALDTTFGNKLIPDDPTKDPLTTDLNTLWAAAGRLLVIDNPGTAIVPVAGNDFIHGSSSVVGPYLNTRNASDLSDFVVDTLVNRASTDTLHQVQTQMTAQQDDIVAAEVGLIAHSLSDSVLGVVGATGAAADIFDSAYGLPNADGTPGVLGAPYATFDVTVPNTTQTRRGLWAESERAGVAPLFDRLDRDAAVRPNLNVVTVDQYHLLDGFVEKMLAYAGAGDPPLTVATIDVPPGSAAQPSPFLNYLPAGQRRVSGAYERFDRGVLGVWNDIPSTSTLPFGGRVRVPEVDLAPIPGSPELNAMTWAEIGPRQIWFDGTTRDPEVSAFLAIVGGLESGPLTSHVVGFDDAAGPATVEFHGGRIYVAYPVLVEPLAAKDPRLKVQSAAIPADWSTLSAASFDESRTFDEIEMPIRAASFGDADLDRFIYPRADLLSADGVLSVAWHDAAVPDSVIEVDSSGLPGETMSYRFADPGVARWAPLTFDTSPLDIVDLPAVNSSRNPLYATAVGGVIAIVQESVLTVEVFAGSSTGEFTLAQRSIVPALFGERSRIALGEWEGQVLLVRNGVGAPIDPTTGLNTESTRVISSSSGAIAVSTPVRNQAPVADAGGPYVTDEGTPIGLDASGSTDPDGDPLTYTWDLNDDGAFGDAAGPVVDFTNVVNEGVHDVTVRVSDGFETSDTTATVTVENVAPVITGSTAESTGPEEEGVVYEVTLDVVDPGLLDALMCTVAWGDGTTSGVGAVAGECSLEHVYADDDTYSLDYSVSDGVASGLASGSVFVANADPRLTVPAAQVVAEGAVLQGVVATFDDPGTLDMHTATIDWGDGSPTEPVAVVENPFGPPGSELGASGTLELPDHTYADNNPGNAPYDAILCVFDDDGGDDCDGFDVTVNNVAPEITSATIDQPAADEGDAVTVMVDWLDPGADSHEIGIDWGDGSTETYAPAFGDRSISVSHTWPDDDPTATPTDDYIVSVTVIDDDLASDEHEVVATVNNVNPTVSLNDLPAAINENDTVTLSGVIDDPSDANGLGDSFQVDVDWGDGATETVMVAESDVRAFELTHQYLDDGNYTVAVSVGDDDGGSFVAPPQAVQVNNLDPIVAAPDPTAFVGTQYSDPFAESVVFTATDVAGYSTNPETLSATADFSGLSLPGQFTLGSPTCVPGTRPGLDEPAQTCSWIIVSSGAPLLLAPGVYPLALTVTDDDGGSHSATVNITVLPEDARATYTGPSFAATTSASDGTATIELRATVRDISIVGGDPARDPYPGDISNADVTFIDRPTGAVLCRADVEFLFAGNEQVGTAACDWTASIGTADAEMFTIGMVVGGYYTRDSGDDDMLITVAKPLDRFITGGGYLDYSDDTLTPAGVYAPSARTRANFGFNVKFNKQGTKLQGQVNLIIRSDGRTYRVKTNRLDSIGVFGDDPTMAEFEARANLTDVTDPDGPVSIGGNQRLQMRMTDFGAPADVDTIAWTLYDKDGVLLLSSNWNGTDTTQHVANGNLALHK